MSATTDETKPAEQEPTLVLPESALPDDYVPKPARSRWTEEYVRTASLVVLATLAICLTLYYVRAVFFPIFLAFILNLVLRPCVRSLVRNRMPPAAASALIMLVFVALLAGGAYRLIDPATRWLKTIPEKSDQIAHKLRAFRQPFVEISKATEEVEAITEEQKSPGEATVTVQQPGLGSMLLDTTNSMLVTFATVMVLLYFLLATGDKLLEKLIALMPSRRSERDFAQMARDIEQGMSTYLATVTCINAGLGVAVGCAMWLLDMPNPALWGVMAACLNFIPYVGAVIGIGLVFLVALLNFETAGEALLIPLAYFTLTAIEGNFVTPTILGRSMSLNPVAVVLSLMFWGWMWGVGGALLAVPLLAIFKIACHHIEQLHSVERLLEE